MSRRVLALMVLLAGGCYVAPSPTTPPPAPECADADGDSYCADIDCNDGDAKVYPGAPDADGDGVDQNCDGYF